MLVTKSSFGKMDDIHQISYDHVPLNSNTWQEVDMSYWTTIHGKLYLNTINLLRPKAYLAQHHMDQVDRKIILTLPEIGLNHNVVTINAIKPAPQFKVCHQSNCSQVIGLFKHYATHVQTYRFINLTTGNISTIHATPNHPFYVKNKHQFLPINEVSSADQLVGESNHIIKLICATNQLDHCGGNYNNQKPSIVYNLEVYQKHDYTVGQSSILVHNVPCDAEFTEVYLQNNGIRIGGGKFGDVYSLAENPEYVYKIYRGSWEDFTETQAQRNARVAMQINSDVPEYTAEAVGMNNDILKMSKLNFKTNWSPIETILVDLKHQWVKAYQARFFFDINPDNVGWLNGKPVFSDTDLIFSIRPSSMSDEEAINSFNNSLSYTSKLNTKRRNMVYVYTENTNNQGSFSLRADQLFPQDF